MSTPEFNTRTILADADSMTLGELKRAVERAAQLGLAPIRAALMAKMELKRHPTISAADGGSEALRGDVSKTLVEIEKLIGRRNYLRRSLASRGCKGAITKIVGDNSVDGRRTLDRLAQVGRLDLALEHVLVRHSTEFDKEVVAKASKNLNQYNKSS